MSQSFQVYLLECIVLRLEMCNGIKLSNWVSKTLYNLVDGFYNTAVFTSSNGYTW